MLNMASTADCPAALLSSDREGLEVTLPTFARLQREAGISHSDFAVISFGAHIDISLLHYCSCINLHFSLVVLCFIVLPIVCTLRQM